MLKPMSIIRSVIFSVAARGVEARIRAHIGREREGWSVGSDGGGKVKGRLTEMARVQMGSVQRPFGPDHSVERMFGLDEMVVQYTHHHRTEGVWYFSYRLSYCTRYSTCDWRFRLGLRSTGTPLLQKHISDISSYQVPSCEEDHPMNDVPTKNMQKTIYLPLLRLTI